MQTLAQVNACFSKPEEEKIDRESINEVLPLTGGE
jgi:hypothetical protein